MSTPEFAPSPARDARFNVVEFWSQCVNLPPGHPKRETEFYNRQLNEEVNGMECAARSLVDFPEADWEMRMAIARQCSDEARHVEMFRGLLESRGGHVGHTPVLNFQYRIITHINDLGGRLAVQNRAFETEGVDALGPEIAACAARGELELSHKYDAQLADEIGHVRFANEYVAEKSRRDPAAVMRIGRALNYALDAFAHVMGTHAMDGAAYGVNRQGRLDAGFSADEIDKATELRAARLAQAQSR